MVGTTLGHYRILRLVGSGGMGEVYAAEDLTLGRTVALKVLPAILAVDPDGLDRFEREARAAAALSHPGIVTLHSFERADGVPFLTMELVDGEPLAARIPPHGVPLDTLLRIGIELADAVAAAHARGIVHRDLKPANLLVAADGRVKVLDFGLARVSGPEGLAGDDATRQITGEGRIVGTVAYMSPEQAEGRPVDHRTDIFSIGVVLYQLATGRLPFQGETAMSVLSAILKDIPRPAIELNPALPPAVGRILKTCLHKDRERRYQSAKDLRNDLQTLKEELDSGELHRPVLPAAPAGRPRRSILAGALVLVLAALGALALGMYLRPAPAPASPVLEYHQLTSAPGLEVEPAVSPDGRWIVYVSNAAGNPDISLQSMTGQTAINLTRDSPAADYQPAFSPDGESIAFRSDRDGGGLYVMGRTGEAPRRVASGGFDPAWSPDGRQLVFATASTGIPTSRSGLSQIRVVGLDDGVVRELTDHDAMHPAWSPDGRFIAFWGMDRSVTSGNQSAVRDLWAVSADGGAPWRLTDDPHVDWSPMWAPDGRFLYFGSNRGGSMNLWRLPMDPRSARPTGLPQAVTAPAGHVGRARLSATGEHLVYEARSVVSNIHRAAFTATQARLGPVEPVTAGSRAFRFVHPSPDGRFLVLGTGFLQQEDLFISEADGSGLRQLTTDAFNDRFPEWAPDGSAIAFYSDRTGKYEIWTTTLAGELRQVTDAADFSPLYPHWSPDGRRMVFSDLTQRRLLAIFDPHRPWGGQTPEILPPPAGEGSMLVGPNVQWSPDGTQLVGQLGDGTVAIYDIASRRYRALDQVRGPIYKWLRDGRFFIGPPEAPRLVDPATGAAHAVALPAFGAEAPNEYRVSHDERTVYFPIARNESDIWLVRIQEAR